MRQVRAIAAMLARIVGLRLSGETEQARTELERSYSLLLGSQAELLRQVDSSTAARLLGTPERVLVLAQFLDEEAEQEADERRRSNLRERAMELRVEAERLDPGNPKLHNHEG